MDKKKMMAMMKKKAMEKMEKEGMEEGMMVKALKKKAK